RNLWRLYGGWWDGNPAQLKPVPDGMLAKEVARLAGGAERLRARAGGLAGGGGLPLACHLIELALQAAPHDAAICPTRSGIYRVRASRERSLMARGIFNAAADEKVKK